ncbi:MAG: phosphodiester glycosidase family protein [bacterium]|nr:phosphodiester glycosidase family protein [bacterium]
MLLAYGQDVVRASSTEIDDKMEAKANKHFICSTKDQKTIYMGVVGGIDIYELPDYLQKNFKCYFALNLDAGYSSAMVYEDKVLERSDRRNIMDAFVVVDREQYKKLTQYEAPYHQPYHPSTNYQLTEQDQAYIDRVSAICHQFITQYGDNLKWKIISLFRKMLDAPQYDNPQNQAIFHQILIKLYTIDQL